MVQRKALMLPAVVSPTKPKRTHVKPHKDLQHQQQDTRTKGGGGVDLMKKMRLIKADGSPNYMKPTKSSVSRKEKPQVTLNIPTRRASFRHVRSLMKKSPLGSPLHPPKVVNRSTCSSTLKDSKSPRALELNPGATVAEGTSAERVCSYNYCSLNGHCHAPLPSLRTFMSARRQSLKSHQSFIKPKVLPPFKDKGSVDTGQTCITRIASGLAIIPLIEEIASGFFVEIFTRPQQVKDSSALPVVGEDEELTGNEAGEESGGDGLSQNDESYSNRGLGDDLDQNSDFFYGEMDVAMNFLVIVECGSNLYIGVAEEKHPSLAPEDLCFKCFTFDGSSKESEGLEESETIISTLGATSFNWEEEEGPIPGNETEYSGNSDNVLSPTSCPLADNKIVTDEFSMGSSSDVFETHGRDAEALLLAYEEGGPGNGSSRSNDSYSYYDKERSGIDVSLKCNAEASGADDNLDGNQPTLAPVSSRETEKDVSLIKEEIDQPLDKELKIFDSSVLGLDEEVSENQEENKEIKYISPGVAGKGDTDFCEGESLESADPEIQKNLDTDALDHSILSNSDTEEDEDGEVEETSYLFIMHHSESCQDSRETTRDMTKMDNIRTVKESEECKWEEVIDNPQVTPEIENTLAIQSDESSDNRVREISLKEQDEGNDVQVSINRATKCDDLEINEVTQIEDDVNSNTNGICFLSSNGNSELHKTMGNMKARMRIIRKITTEEQEQIKEFKPRPPRYLPTEPEPEAENVDLKHQMMDERKNAEDWMIDYALRQAVSKLALARKRKVALLVEAFETVVISLPMCEESLTHATSGFARSRPVQACN